MPLHIHCITFSFFLDLYEKNIDNIDIEKKFDHSNVHCLLKVTFYQWSIFAFEIYMDARESGVLFTHKIYQTKIPQLKWTTCFASYILFSYRRSTCITLEVHKWRDSWYYKIFFVLPDNLFNALNLLLVNLWFCGSKSVGLYLYRCYCRRKLMK